MPWGPGSHFPGTHHAELFHGSLSSLPTLTRTSRTQTQMSSSVTVKTPARGPHDPRAEGPHMGRDAAALPPGCGGRSATAEGIRSTSPWPGALPHP